MVRNIQKSKDIFHIFVVTQEGLLGNQAQIKEDLTVLSENVVSEPSKLELPLGSNNVINDIKQAGAELCQAQFKLGLAKPGVGSPPPSKLC